MKIRKKFVLIVSLVITISIAFYACKKNYDFLEITRLDDSIGINPIIAAPLVNTEIKLKYLLPDADSSMWFEMDNSDVIHIKIYKDLFTFYAGDIYTCPITSGSTVSKDSIHMTTQFVDLKINDSTVDGHLFLYNPILKLRYTNHIPIITKVRIQNIYYYETPNSAALPFTGTFVTQLNNGYTITYPGISSPQDNIGRYIKDSLLVDRSNSNFAAVASTTPKQVSFDAWMICPGGIAPYQIEANFPFHLEFECDIPAEIRVDDLEIKDTSDLGYDFSDDTYNISNALLKIKIQNGLPIEGNYQGYLLDSMNNVLDSLFKQPSSADGSLILSPANIDNNGFVTTSTTTEISTYIDKTRFDKLKNGVGHGPAKNLVSKYLLNTKKLTPGQYVKLRSNNSISIKIGLKAEGTISTKDTNLIK